MERIESVNAAETADRRQDVYKELKSRICKDVCRQDDADLLMVIYEMLQ